ncbi:MAG: class 1 fructose-bisphosphatase [Thermoprotei archaeon]
MSPGSEHALRNAGKSAEKYTVSLGQMLSETDQDFRKLVSTLLRCGLKIRAEIPKELGALGGVNVYGERQIGIDVWSNDLLASTLLESGLVKEVGSEELSEPKRAADGEFSVVFDPIDGSSNVATNNPVGTIVGVYRGEPLPARGDKLVSAMYMLYGEYTQLVLALDKGVFSFVDSGRGGVLERFKSTGRKIEISDPGEVYGVGGHRYAWPEKLRKFVDSLESRKLKLRYCGCFVGDFNQILFKGGFFAYPELSDSPQGKYRLQFESNPMAYITEKAGGKASDGARRILTIEPTSISQRTPTYVGSHSLVSEYEALAVANS